MFSGVDRYRECRIKTRWSQKERSSATESLEIPRELS